MSYNFENGIKIDIPDSYVFNKIKSAETTGNGEAKLYVGQTSSEENLDKLFLNKKIYLRKDEIVRYLEESRLAYQCQLFGKYRECSFDYWEEKLKEAKELEEEIIILESPTKFISGNRYYIRLEDEFFRKYFRGIILPLITELMIRNMNKDGENYVCITPLIKKEVTEFLKIKEVNSSDGLDNYAKVFIGYETKDISYNFDEEDLNELNDIKTNIEILEKFKIWMENKDLSYRTIYNYLGKLKKIAAEIFNMKFIKAEEEFYFLKADELSEISKKYFLIESVKYKNEASNHQYSASINNFINFLKETENDGISLSKNNFEKLSKYKNSYQKIVYGAPGTGKSYSLAKEADSLFSDFSVESEILDKQNPDISFWLVGATWGSDNKYDEFINNNYWINGWDDGYDFERAKNLKIGDYIIIKTSYFTGEKNSTPTLEIKAIGKVNKISQPGKQVGVNWLKKNLGIVIKGENFRSTVHNISKRLSLIDKIFTNQNLLNSYSEDIKTKERVTFYDGYTYGQFVGAYKPIPVENENEKADITYNYIPGPLFRHLVKAFNNPEHNFVLIIEEINRARADRVFGNIFQLLDRDKTGKSEYPISLSEEQDQYFRENMFGERYAETIEARGGLHLPHNLYIWATMNSADQGVYPMDSAFKRRWNFEYIGLDKNAENFGDKEYTYYISLYKTGGTSEKGNPIHELAEWNDFRKTINNILLHEVRVPEDRLFAPFFVKPENFDHKDPEHEKNLWINEEVFKSKILMYLFDDILRHRGKEKIFSSNIRSFSELIATYEAGENIFNEEITNKLLKKEEPKVQV